MEAGAGVGGLAEALQLRQPAQVLQHRQPAGRGRTAQLRPGRLRRLRPLVSRLRLRPPARRTATASSKPPVQ